MDTPRDPSLQRAKSRISAESWKRRVDQAIADEVVLKKILAKVARGSSLDAAIGKVLPASRRSWAIRRVPVYRKDGLEGLIDSRTPREPKVSNGCRQALLPEERR